MSYLTSGPKRPPLPPTVHGGESALPPQSNLDHSAARVSSSEPACTDSPYLGITIDVNERELIRDGESTGMIPPLPFLLASALYRGGKTFQSRKDLVKAVYGEDEAEDSSAFDQLKRRLSRAYLAKIRVSIQNNRAGGWRLRLVVAEAAGRESAA